MARYEFTVIVEGIGLTDADLNALFEAGCDDATFGEVNGTVHGDFSREAPDYGTAVGSAVSAIEGALEGARVTEVLRGDDAVAATG